MRRGTKSQQLPFLLSATVLLITAAALQPGLPAADTESPKDKGMALIDPAQPQGGWKFGNGPEFPGAQGELKLAGETFRGQPVLSLHGDFTKGGNYVQAGIVLPPEKIDTISFWVNSPAGSQRLPIRIQDEDNRVHQINIKLNEKGGWQYIVLPFARFLKTMGTPGALDTVASYESWDGQADSEKHHKDFTPGGNLWILASRAMGGEKGTLLISDVRFQAANAKQALIRKTIQLDEMLQASELDWGFNLGQEFAGAKGNLDLIENQPAAGKYAMRLHADFRDGGAYVGVRRKFAQLDVEAITAFRFKMRSAATTSFAVRMVDGTGQCHQRKDLPLTADGQWHEVTLVPSEIAGGEHWGGANDGKWHDSVQLVELMLNTRSHEGKQPELFLSDIRADVTLEAAVQPSAFSASFEPGSSLAPSWQATGDVKTAATGRDKPAGALVLARPLDKLQTETQAIGPRFAVTAGLWQMEYTWKSDLHSPDNSYHAAIALEVFDRSGNRLEIAPVAIGYGKTDWQTTVTSVELPRGAAEARFRIELNKTYGAFRLGALSAAPLSTQPIERRIERILLATDATGNLFLPGEPVAFHVTVEAIKPLPADEQTLQYSVRDYWGAEQLAPGQIALEKQGRKDGRFIYTADVHLPAEQLAVGKFYEFHVAVPQQAGDPVTEFSGLAVLPAAASKQFPPEDIPFTIRNWDSRVPAYFDLADRIGLRLIGVWGGWSPKEPYKPHCPGIDRCAQMGAKWITGTPAASVERKGFSEYSEQSLRKGMRNFLEAYANQGLAMIAMGNEPHGTGDKVLENVRAYKAIYESVKAFDPAIHVIGTSVEPNEEYFKAGYQNYLDSYDFHIYERYTDVRRTMQAYRELMRKYNAVKPLHSTELGLNSQGQTRRDVAMSMIKKFTVFFAEGGATVSWFTIQYPDPQGKARGQFGDAHCIFDCKYNLYNPRLDAITHYYMLNGICDKQFVEEKHYPDGEQAYLFRDDRGGCLQVLWLDDQRRDMCVPIASGRQVELIRLDGQRTRLESQAGGVAVTLSEEPALLLYQDDRQGLAPSLKQASVCLKAPPAEVAPGDSTSFVLEGAGLDTASLQVTAPPFWKTSLEKAGESLVQVTLTAPAATSARQARVYVQPLRNGKPTGELSISVRVTR